MRDRAAQRRRRLEKRAFGEKRRECRRQNSHHSHPFLLVAVAIQRPKRERAHQTPKTKKQWLPSPKSGLCSRGTRATSSRAPRPTRSSARLPSRSRSRSPPPTFFTRSCGSARASGRPSLASARSTPSRRPAWSARVRCCCCARAVSSARAPLFFPLLLIHSEPLKPCLPLLHTHTQPSQPPPHQ